MSRPGAYIFYGSIRGDAISKNLIVPQRVTLLAAAVAGVALDGIYSAILDLFYNANMVGQTVRTVSFFFVPVKEDDHAGCRFCAVVCPLPSFFESVDTADTSGEFGNDTRIDVTAHVGAPFYTGTEAIPGPARFAAHIATMGQGNGNDHIVRRIDAVQHHCPERTVLSSEQLIQLRHLVIGFVIDPIHLPTGRT